MRKKALSLFLVLCMVLTMLPVSTLAEESNTPIGARIEIIGFASLTETEKTVMTGTSIADLELPESLTATVRTALIGEEEKVAEIPVTWTSEPEYYMDAEGKYAFEPVIEGYTVSDETAVLPQCMGKSGWHLMLYGNCL